MLSNKMTVSDRKMVEQVKSRVFSDMSTNGLSGILALFTRDYSEDMGELIGLIAYDILLRELGAGVKVTFEMLLEKVWTLLDMVALLPTIIVDALMCGSSVLNVGVGHSPETYMAWINGLTGTELFDRTEQMKFDFTAMPMSFLNHGTLQIDGVLTFSEEKWAQLNETPIPTGEWGESLYSYITQVRHNAYVLSYTGLLPKKIAFFSEKKVDRVYMQPNYNEEGDLLLFLPG